MAKQKKGWVLPKVGDAVVVRWVDSGAGAVGAPGLSRSCHLYIKTTCGRVVSCQSDDLLDIPKSHSKETLVLAMCSAGGDDYRSELAAIWVPSIIFLKNFGSDGIPVDITQIGKE